MYEYRLRTPDKTSATALAAAFGIDWDGEQQHLTVKHELPDGQVRRMDVAVLGDLPLQLVDGTIVTEVQEVDGEDVEVPLMVGLFHIDIISTNRIIDPGANAYEVQPAHPLHRWL